MAFILRRFQNRKSDEKVLWSPESENPRINQLKEVAKSLKEKDFKEINLVRRKEKKVWVGLVKVEIAQLKGSRMVAIVMNAPTAARKHRRIYLSPS